VLTSILVIVAIAGLIYVTKRWSKLSDSERKDFSKKVVIYGGLGIVLALVVSGRAHWVMGALAGLLAIASRAAQLAQYFPLFKKLMGDKEPSGGAVVSKGEMTPQEAAEILGIEQTASDEEIRLAHKKLMQKIHVYLLSSTCFRLPAFVVK